MTAQEAIEKFKRIKRGNIYLIHQRIEGKEVIEDYSLCDMVISTLEKLDSVPSAQPEIIRCEYCKHHHYENKDIPYCDRIDYGYGWKDDDFCSKAERREDERSD